MMRRMSNSIDCEVVAAQHTLGGLVDSGVFGGVGVIAVGVLSRRADFSCKVVFLVFVVGMVVSFALFVVRVGVAFTPSMIHVGMNRAFSVVRDAISLQSWLIFPEIWLSRALFVAWLAVFVRNFA